MQKSIPQQVNVPNQPAARQGRGGVADTAQTEQITQLEALIDSSPQVEKQGQLATLMHTSPNVAAQRKQSDMMFSSPRQTAQRKTAEGISNSPTTIAQLKKHEGLFGTAQLQSTGQSSGSGLPDNLKSGIENLSGMSMDGVKVHYNSSQPAQLNAHAYAQGTDIHVAPGQEQHLPHEAWHVVQQAQGRVKPTLQAKGVPVNDDVSLESEADQMGAKALQTSSHAMQLNAEHGARLAAINHDVAQATQGASMQQRQAIQREVTEQLQSRFLIDDGQATDGKVDKSQFLAAMQAQVLEVSKRVLGPFGLAQDDCPDLKYWVGHYGDKDAGYVEDVIARYAPATQDAKDWNEYLSLLVARIETGLIEHTQTGAAVDPEPVPDSIDQQRQPVSVLGIQRMEAPVAQLGCASSTVEDKDKDKQTGTSGGEAKTRAGGEDVKTRAGDEQSDAKAEDSPAITKIKSCDLSAMKAVNIGSSRQKNVYFFDAVGNNLVKSDHAVFMLDTNMKQDEVENYEKVRAKGILVPKIYGSRAEGVIVQYLPNQTTVTNQFADGMAKSATAAIGKLKLLRKWKPAAWQSALTDLNLLISTGYSSPDLQFMVDNDGGHIYVMDMEAKKPPSFDGSSTATLEAVKIAIEEALKG